MKSIIAALVVLFLVLQYQLWFASGGLLSAWSAKEEIEKQKIINARYEKRNKHLEINIKALKHGKDALEEHARNDLGMVKKDETFYQVVKSDSDNS